MVLLGDQDENFAKNSHSSLKSWKQSLKLSNSQKKSFCSHVSVETWSLTPNKKMIIRYTPLSNVKTLKHLYILFILWVQCQILDQRWSSWNVSVWCNHEFKFTSPHESLLAHWSFCRYSYELYWLEIIFSYFFFPFKYWSSVIPKKWISKLCKWYCYI